MWRVGAQKGCWIELGIEGLASVEYNDALVSCLHSGEALPVIMLENGNMWHPSGLPLVYLTKTYVRKQ